mgnify:CR=1 FL=1
MDGESPNINSSEARELIRRKYNRIVNGTLPELLEILDKEDVLILTALTQNQQQLLFEKIGFKKLFPIKIEELILLLQENHLHVHKAFLTPNDTYATIIITKYHDEEVKLSLAT